MRRDILVALALLTRAIPAEAGGGCSLEQAIRAEETAGSLATWSAVHDHFLQFRQCDDGAIAEGYDESITLLLDEQWRTLGALAAFTSKDRDFLAFVLRHIELTVPADRLARIGTRARSECPPSLTDLCASIAAVTPSN